MIDVVAVNKAFWVGFNRNNDVLELVPHDDDGMAEIVGIFMSSLTEWATRSEKDPLEVLIEVGEMIKEDD